MELLAIVNELGGRLKRELPATLGFDYPTIHALADFLANVSDAHGTDSQEKTSINFTVFQIITTDRYCLKP